MSGWCPSSSVCGMAVVCTATFPPNAVAWLVPYSSHCSADEYCCHVVHCSLPGAVVWCGVCVCAVRVVGYLLSTPPLVVVEGGAIVDGGVPLWMVGGMVSEGRLCGWPPRSCAVSPFCLRGGPVEWREWRSCVVPVLFTLFPVLELDPASCIVRSPLHCIPLCCAVCFLFVLPCCCVVCEEEGSGVCGVCGLVVNVVFFSFSLPSL